MRLIKKINRMNLKKVFIIPLFSLLLSFSISCDRTKKEQIPNKKLKENEHVKNFTLSNTLYLLAPEFNGEKCESFGECDCCTSNYLFLDNENFICVDYCLEANTYYSGKYKIEKENVQLKFNSVMVQKEYNWESETDTINDQPKYFYKTEKCKSFETIWTKFDCKGRYYFKNITTETNYASIDKTLTAKNFVIKLKGEGIWDKLLN